MKHRLLLLPLLLLSCARTPPSASPPAPVPAPVVTPAPAPLPEVATPTELPPAVTHTVLPTAEVAQDASIYDLPAKLVDQNGKDIALDVWRGQPTIVALFFASCPQACPLLIGNIQYIEGTLTPAERAQLRVLLVSFEPVADTPEVLRKVIRKYGLDANRWRLTRTDAETVRDVAAVLGVAYRRLDDGSFNHSSVITLVDGEGHIVARQDGIVRSKEPVGPAIAKLLTARK
jgi:protein SCO1/2